MKLTKILVATAILVGSALSSNAQLSLGAQAGLTGNSYFGKSLTFGLRGEYSIKDQVSVGGSVNYALPKSFASTMTLGFGGSNQTTVESEETVSLININAEAKRYTFGTEFEDDVAPYFLVGAGLNLYSFKEKVTGNYDQTMYSPEESKESFAGFTINVGMGVDIMLGDNFLMIEAKGMIPANQVNGEAIEVQIPFSYGLFVGYRIAF